MKSVQKLLLVGTLAALASGCSGKASPEASITCSGSAGTTSFVNNLAMVQKTIQANDPGLGGDVPANGITATVISPTSAVQICEGDCLDGSGSFKQEQEVAVDDNGIFLYTVGIDPAQPFTGDIIEVFSAVDSCFTTITIN